MESHDALELPKYFLQPGYIFISKEPHLVHTVLGSCVSVCVWDAKKLYGGMNHYIYDRFRKERNTRYGDVSIPYLIKLMHQEGSKITDLKVHLLGGAQNPNLGSSLGKLNSELAVEYFGKNGIEVLSKDLGGVLGRKVVFNNSTGEILVYKLNRIRNEDWYE